MEGEGRGKTRILIVTVIDEKGRWRGELVMTVRYKGKSPGYRGSAAPSENFTSDVSPAIFRYALPRHYSRILTVQVQFWFRRFGKTGRNLFTSSRTLVH